MLQTIITILIVAAAFFFLGRRLWRTARGRGGCGCGCADCPHKNGCSRK